MAPLLIESLSSVCTNETDVETVLYKPVVFQLIWKFPDFLYQSEGLLPCLDRQQVLQVLCLATSSTIVILDLYS
jgi:hypothetical protein